MIFYFHSPESCMISLTNELKGLQAYVNIYRPIVTSCNKPHCHVFCNRDTTPSVSCSPMSVTNIGKVMSKMGQRVGLSTRVGTRKLRRSQITALLVPHMMRLHGLCLHARPGTPLLLDAASMIWAIKRPGRNRSSVAREKLREVAAEGEDSEDDDLFDC